VHLKPGTHGCVVVEGDLTDPYTAAVVHFTKPTAARVQIDHVLPLSAGWDLGAATWSLQRRMGSGE
jgi:hypothetical protein